jgi:hypothetical protein
MNDDVNIYFILFFLLIWILCFQISTLKNARLLCSTITQKGANLHELLGKELDARVYEISFCR